jgi:hypothetical protein
MILWGHTSSHRLTFTVITIGTEARLEPTIKGEGGSSRMQRYEKISYIPTFLQKYSQKHC